jgi:hypothetical protein
MAAEENREHYLERIELGLALGYPTVGPHKTGRKFLAQKKSTEGSACATAIDRFGKYALVARFETAG